MASKEATVYIVDVGRSMGERRHGRSHTDLDWALDYIWDKITTTVSQRPLPSILKHSRLEREAFEKYGENYSQYFKVATGRKTALMSVIGCRTDDTDLGGILDEDEGYGNIQVFSPVKQYLLEDIQRLQKHLKPSRTNNGDSKFD